MYIHARALAWPCPGAVVSGVHRPPFRCAPLPLNCRADLSSVWRCWIPACAGMTDTQKLIPLASRKRHPGRSRGPNWCRQRFGSCCLPPPTAIPVGTLRRVQVFLCTFSRSSNQDAAPLWIWADHGWEVLHKKPFRHYLLCCKGQSPPLATGIKCGRHWVRHPVSLRVVSWWNREFHFAIGS